MCCCCSRLGGGFLQRRPGIGAHLRRTKQAQRHVWRGQHLDSYQTPSRFRQQQVCFSTTFAISKKKFKFRIFVFNFSNPPNDVAFLEPSFQIVRSSGSRFVLVSDTSGSMNDFVNNNLDSLISSVGSWKVSNLAEPDRQIVRVFPSLDQVRHFRRQ